jgi:tetratricopeptide (TPR) repeat protein
VEIQSDRPGARRLWEQSLALYRALDARWEMAYMLHWLGAVSHILGLYDRAGQALQEALALWRELGDQAGILGSLALLGTVRVQQGDFPEAERLQEEALALYWRMAAPLAGAAELRALAWIFLAQGRSARARALGEEVLAADSVRADRALSAEWTLEMGNAELGLGRYAAARLQAQRGLMECGELNMQAGVMESLALLGYVAAAEGQYAEAWQRLQESMDLRERIVDQGTAGVLTALGGVALLMGNPDQAGQYLGRALRMVAGHRGLWGLTRTLPFVARLLAERGEVERAVEIYALASHYPLVAHSQWCWDLAGQRITELAASLPPHVVAAAQERGRARDLWATAEELLAELEGEISAPEG